MTNTTPPQPTYAPTPGLVTDTWHRPAPTAVPTITAFAHPAALILELPADHHQAVDWVRARRAVRVCCSPASITGLAFSPLWAHFALPLAVDHQHGGLGAAVGLGFLTAVWTGIALATGRIPRGLTIAVLVAVGAGTLELTPVAIAHHLMES